MTEPRALCLLGKHSASRAMFLPRTFLPWLECNLSQRNKYLLVHACNSSTGETVGGKSGVQSHPQLHREFVASPGSHRQHVY